MKVSTLATVNATLCHFLQTGDVIHGLNSATITSLADLREGMAKFSPGDAVALQIERLGQIIYVSFTF